MEHLVRCVEDAEYRRWALGARAEGRAGVRVLAYWAGLEGCSRHGCMVAWFVGWGCGCWLGLQKAVMAVLTLCSASKCRAAAYI